MPTLRRLIQNATNAVLPIESVPETRMPIRRQSRLVSDAELTELLARFEAGTTVDENRVLHFHHLDSGELERILPDAFEADPGFTGRQLRYLLREALWTSRKNGPLTNDALLSEARRIARLRLSQPPRRYAMWTKFRARQMAFASSFRLSWNEVSFQSASDLPVYMQQDEYFLNGYGDVDPRMPIFFGYLITRCDARDEENAVARMLDATDIVMALFNMYEMRGRWAKGNERWAEGKLWHGPYHFVFEGRRFLGGEHVWFNSEFDEEAWGVHPIDMPAVLRFIPQVRAALAALTVHPLRGVLVRVLRLMQNAMGSRDQSYSLLRYWSALEQLYGDPQAREKNYTRIIQRAAFAEHDPLIARWKLGHISRVRNEYVHARDHDDDLRVMAQYLRMLLTRHVHYLMLHAPNVRSHAHWLEIVDLPSDEALLRERKDVIDMRLAIISQGRRQGEADVPSD
ncbi:hypothetical protein J2W40_003700 [Sphingobium xenophagum]|uniref:Apea-like HEPN domain-containing protein n=1 Tax=Sphingobium xenophagum TaxID=121428 RepID=A0ABU1X5V4_SPHXE|nr:hypothetical protein [Sphingobium xenophagum]MDR7156854.1 hypothetical protein [Sphingobium xenophagum]